MWPPSVFPNLNQAVPKNKIQVNAMEIALNTMNILPRQTSPFCVVWLNRLACPFSRGSGLPAGACCGCWAISNGCSSSRPALAPLEESLAFLRCRQVRPNMLNSWSRFRDRNMLSKCCNAILLPFPSAPFRISSAIPANVWNKVEPVCSSCNFISDLRFVGIEGIYAYTLVSSKRSRNIFEGNYLRNNDDEEYCNIFWVSVSYITMWLMYLHGENPWPAANAVMAGMGDCVQLGGSASHTYANSVKQDDISKSCTTIGRCLKRSTRNPHYVKPLERRDHVKLDFDLQSGRGWDFQPVDTTPEWRHLSQASDTEFQWYS